MNFEKCRGEQGAGESSHVYGRNLRFRWLHLPRESECNRLTKTVISGFARVHPQSELNLAMTRPDYFSNRHTGELKAWKDRLSRSNPLGAKRKPQITQDRLLSFLQQSNRSMR